MFYGEKNQYFSPDNMQLWEKITYEHLSKFEWLPR
jgi:hypothetical protein